MPWRVAGGVHHLERSELVAVLKKLVDRARSVLGAVEPEPDLERDQPQRLPGPDADRLGATVARDDVGLPLVRIQSGAARAHERSHAAEVRAMPVRNRDPL